MSDRDDSPAIPRGDTPGGSLDGLQARLVAASRELSRARRRRVRRRGAVCAALIVLVTPPALAATGVWRPALGDGEGPAPEISADAPPPDQLAMLGVLRREQTEADRGVATRYALKFVDSPGMKGVRTDSIRLLAQSDEDRGVVLVPVKRYERRLPGEIPPELRKRVERTIDDALCVYQLDIDGAGVACYSSEDVKQGNVWMGLGRRTFMLVPDGVASVRTEYVGHDRIDAPVRENAVVFTRPAGLVAERRIVFLDTHGKPVHVIDREIGPTHAPPTRPATGATRTGAVRHVRIQGQGHGREAAYDVLVRTPHDGHTLFLVLERPACAGKRRVMSSYGGLRGDLQVVLTPSFGDDVNARWCPGTYRGSVRVKDERKPLGTFSFRVR